MPLHFLNPGLLFGAAGALVPLVLHLLRNRRVRRVPFSDLRFLKAVEVRRARTSSLLRLLLLLLRMLAILLIVMGAARPRIGGLGAAAGDGASVLAVLDASASMQTRSREGVSRFDEALDAARSLAGALPRGGEVQWLRAGPSAAPVFGAWLPAPAAADPDAASPAPGDGGFDLARALEAAASAAREASRPPVVALISDMQPVSADAAALTTAVAGLTAAGVSTVELITVGEEVLDGAVLDVDLPLTTVRPGRTIRITARVRPAREDQPFRLELDGRVAAEAVASGDGATETDVVFALTAPGAGRHPGRVSTVTDLAPHDDARAFVLDVADRLDVLLVHGTGRDDWRYLARALDPDWDAPAPDAPVALTVAGDAGWSGGDLDAHDVLILADPEPLGRERLAALRAWLGRGGGLWLVAGDPARGDYLRDHLLPAVAPGAELEGYRDRSAVGAEALRVTAPDHPVFAGLPADALATLTESRWRRGWSLDAGDADVLLHLEGGDPLLLAPRTDAGRALLSTASLGDAAGDLARNAMFPPLAQRLAGWLAGGRAAVVTEAGARLAAPVDPAAAGGIDGGLTFRFHPADGTVAPRSVDATLAWRNDRPVAKGPAETGAGAWILRRGSGVYGATVTVVPRAEASPAAGDADAVAALLEAAGIATGRTLAGARGEGGAMPSLTGRDLSAWCFLAAVLVLLAEARLARGGRTGGAPARA